MPMKLRHHLNLLVAAALALAALGAAPGAGAAETNYDGISADGSVAFFSTTKRLVPGDTDSRLDIYVRSFDAGAEGYVTREASIGPTGGNNAYPVQYLASDAAGDRVFFSTQERLTAADKDNATDVYVRNLTENRTTLVSAGDPSCAAAGCGEANIPVNALPGGVVDEGNTVFFVSEEKLSAADGDGAADVYARDILAGTTTLVSAADPACGSCGGGSQPAVFRAASADGGKAVFTTREALAGEDTDGGEDDIYERDLSSGETKLVSPQGSCPESLNCTPVFEGASIEATHVFFETNDQIGAGDSDSSQDVYDWSGSAPVRVLTGEGGGNGASNALYAGSSPDGAAVFFETKEELAPEDGDSAQDVYERSGGETTLVSQGDSACAPACGDGGFDAGVVRRSGAPSGVLAGGDVVFFSTAESLTEADGDSSKDIYRRDLPAGPTTLVSGADPSCTLSECGEAPQDPVFAAASTDGSLAFFETVEPLVDGDTDGRKDVYAGSSAATTWVSVGSINGNGNHEARLDGASEEGALAFFTTKERLTDEDDFAGEEDVYSRGLPTGPTLLVSQGNDAELESKLAPPPPLLERTDPPSPAPLTEPKVIGSEAEAAASIKLYETEDCSGEPVATGDAEELAEPGIAVSVESGATTVLRATAEAEGFVSACSGAISYKQEEATLPGEESGGGEEPGGGGEESGGGGSESGASSTTESGVEESGGGGSGGGSTSSPAPTYGGGQSYVAPATRITFGPAFKTRARRPVFRFTDSTGQPGTRFICRVDRARWRWCDSPVRLKHLRRGRHVFRVKARNAVGAWEARPTSRVFKLVRGGGNRNLRRHRHHSKRGRR